MYCRMLPLEHSAIHLTFIKLPFVIKIFALSIFEWPLKIGFIELKIPNHLPHLFIFQVCVFSEDTHTQKASFRVTTGTMNTTAIKSIEFARRGE